MRLFDKCLTQGSEPLRKMFRHEQSQDRLGILAADTIAEHYYENKQLLWGAEDYPYALPPWKSTFVEWNEPPFIVTENGRERVERPAQIGVYLLEGKRGRKAVESASALIKHATDEAPDIPGSVEWVLVGKCISFTRGILNEFDVTTFAFLRADGWLERLAHIGRGLRPIIEAIGLAEAQRFFDSQYHIVWLAFTFANCTNVKLQDVTEQLAPPPKIRRRLKIPEVKRYTLNIEGHYTTPSRNSNEPMQGVMPFHLCRGHFATYTTERPRFGRLKDGVGRFWIPPHMKGKKENGEVIKDYAITAPAFSEAAQ
jgi:hypothetical protein